jgi:hypothetical protein
MIGITLAALLVAARPALAQLAIDVPAADSTSSMTTVAGWACHTGASDPGVDAVEVWLFPLPTGDWQYLGAATIGIQRDDVAAAMGGNCHYSGYSLSTSNLHAGLSQVWVFARNSSTDVFDLSASKTATVYEADPQFHGCDTYRCAAVTSASYNASLNTVTVAGWAVVDANHNTPTLVSAVMVIDDWSSYGWADPTAVASDACASFPTWNCSPAKANQLYGSTAPGFVATVNLYVDPGWHVVRLWLAYDNNPPSEPETTASNAWWFYVN